MKILRKFDESTSVGSIIDEKHTFDGMALRIRERKKKGKSRCGGGKQFIKEWADYA